MGYEIVKVKPGEDLSGIMKLRKEIFGSGEDDLDELGINVLLKKDGIPAAVGRILLDMENDRLIIDMIGVRENLRRQHVATELLDELMNIAAECESSEVWAKPQKNEIIKQMLKKHGFEEMDPYRMCVDIEYYC